MEYIKFLSLLILAWGIAEGFAVAKWAKELLNIHSDTKSKNLFVRAAMKLTNCSMCLGFWIGLTYYQGFLMAILTSFCAMMFQRLTNKFL